MNGKTSLDAMPAGTTSGTPQVLLGHHLKQLKLPTVLRDELNRTGFAGGCFV